MKQTEIPQQIIYLSVYPPLSSGALFLLVLYLQCAGFSLVCSRPFLSVRLPGSPPCGVGSAVTSARCGVNRAEHVDQALDQQGGSSTTTRQEFVSFSFTVPCRVFTQDTFEAYVKMFINIVNLRDCTLF